MFDAVSFGKRVQERRKAQGLTQEQLGAELRVTNQSVSKWENGESVPDLILIPPLCKALGTTSDFLLGIDGGIGIESLSKELAGKIGSMKRSARVDALMKALKHLALLRKFDNNPQYIPGTDTPYVPGTYMAFDWRMGQLPEMRLWRNNGLACFVAGDILQSIPTDDNLRKLRTFIDVNCWKVARLLLSNPKKEQDLLDGVAGSAESIKRALAELIEAGLVKLDTEGYKLDVHSGLPWAILITAMANELRKQPISVYFNRVPLGIDSLL